MHLNLWTEYRLVSVFKNESIQEHIMIILFSDYHLTLNKVEISCHNGFIYLGENIKTFQNTRSFY